MNERSERAAGPAGGTRGAADPSTLQAVAEQVVVEEIEMPAGQPFDLRQRGVEVARMQGAHGGEGVFPPGHDARGGSLV